MERRDLFTYAGLGFLIIALIDVFRGGGFTQFNVGLIMLSVFLLLSSKMLRKV